MIDASRTRSAKANGTDHAEKTAERPYYSVSQAAAWLGVSRVTIWRWIRGGRLLTSRLGHRTVRIAHQDLVGLLQREIIRGKVRLPSGKPNPAAANANNFAFASHAPHVDWSALANTRHFAQLYEADEVLLEAVGSYIGTALRNGEVGLVFATPEHRTQIEQHLRGQGLDLKAPGMDERYFPLDAAGALERIMVDGAPDPEQFGEVIGGAIKRAAAGGRRVRAFGEAVALLAADGKPAAAIRFEQLWNELLQERAFTLFCAYPVAQLGKNAVAGLVEGVCTEHASVIPAESYSALNSEGDRLRAIAVLQQKAQVLEAELDARKRAEERLQRALVAEEEARRSAESALRLRDEFLTIASHELRTPLAVLSLQAQLAARRAALGLPLEPERVTKTLAVISSQTDKLAELVAQLLSVSRLEAGELVIETAPSDLCSLVGRIVAQARDWSERHMLRLESPPSLLGWVDPLRFEQVLTHLLKNAVKYSPDGGAIEIGLSDTGNGDFELSVLDRGLGIPSAKRAHVFDRFYQAHGEGYQSGMGLGLYICRRIVEGHGGDIRAELPSDGGTRIVVRMPLRGSHPERSADSVNVQEFRQPV